MQTEQEWANRIDTAEDFGAAERYQYFMRPEPFEDLGPISLVQDTFLNRKMKARTMKIGMVRNATEENKKSVLVFLEPFPHIRIDTAKPLQGWYKSLHEPEGVRNRPCFSEAVLTEPFGGFCAVGCAFCVVEGEPIGTQRGIIPIEEVKPKDRVYGRRFGGTYSDTEVEATASRTSGDCVALVLSTGETIRLTSDHLVWRESIPGGWVEAGKLLTGDILSGERKIQVSKVDRIKREYRVYDIQTGTGNFLIKGVLVHNCYINSGMRGYRGSGLITVPLNYGEQIKKQLSKMYRGAAGYFSSFTDPFTPLEAYYHNTELAAREFVAVGLPIFFLSRLRYPDWALELLTKNPHSYAQKSINTCDANDWRHLSPGALPLKQHFSDITRLKKAGIYVSIQVNPILPGVTSHEQVETLFKQLKEAGADHVIVKFVEAGYSWANSMVERIIRRFGKERGEAFAALFTENIGGQRTITEDYRLPAHERYAAAAKRLGLTYATCYEYRKERDATGKIINSTGVSIGREFTTAEQCHGQRVPVYSRSGLDEQFKPLDECPPSGCLYCASENNGEPRCGDADLGAAKAIRAADYKKPLIQIGA
jgi:DNA repair photolyase